MKKLSYLPVLFSLILGSFTPDLHSADATSTPATTQKPASAATKKYENAEKNYSIEHPEAWIKKEMAKLDLVLFAPGKDGASDPVASMNIVSEKIEEKVTLDQFYNESLTNLKSALKDVKIDNSGEKSLNGTPSKWIDYTHDMQGIKFEVLQYFIVANDTVYLLTFSSPANTFSTFRPDFERAAESFKAKDTSKK